MATFTITLPTEFAIVSREVGVTANFEKLGASMIEKLVLHGITQKVADSAAGAMKGAGFEGRKFTDLTGPEQAAVQAWGKNAMAETLATLESGLWAERKASGAATSTPLEAMERNIFAADLRKNDKKAWAEIKDAEDKNDLLAALIDNLSAAKRAILTESAQDELDAKARTAARMAKMAIAIDLEVPAKK